MVQHGCVREYSYLGPTLRHWNAPGVPPRVGRRGPGVGAGPRPAARGRRASRGGMEPRGCPAMLLCVINVLLCIDLCKRTDDSLNNIYIARVRERRASVTNLRGSTTWMINLGPLADAGAPSAALGAPGPLDITSEYSSRMFTCGL